MNKISEVKSELIPTPSIFLAAKGLWGNRNGSHPLHPFPMLAYAARGKGVPRPPVSSAMAARNIDSSCSPFSKMKQILKNFGKMLAIVTLGTIFLNGPAIAADDQKVLVLADIHFSPFADCKGARNCPLVEKLNQAGAEQWAGIFSQYGHDNLPQNGQETNYALFKILLNQIQQQQPKNVLILGDFLAHRYRTLYMKYAHDRNRDHYNNFVINTMKYLTSAIQQAMPADGAIYPVIGNNDSFGGQDCAYPDYCVIANGAFFQALTKPWGALFRNSENQAQFTAEFPRAGYYEVTLPNTRDHIIVLNTVLFSTKAHGPDVDNEAQAQLQWLQQKLQQIADAKEKTWIIFHIPPGIDAYSSAKNFLGIVVAFWDSRYSKPFLNLVHQYSTEITGVLSGHLHMDGFVILDMKNGNNVILDTFVPSISPIFGNNPSYKIYSYSNQPFTLHTFATFYLNLHNSDIASKPNWQQEYNFSEAYQPTDGLVSGYQRMNSDVHNTFSAEYIQFYSVQTTSQPINQGKWNYYWCATNNLETNDYKSCLKTL